MKKILLLLLLVLASSHALNLVGCTQGTIDALIDEATQGLLVVLMTLTVVSLAVGYMFSYAFNKQDYLIIIKDEFFHLLVSILILLFFGTVMEFSCVLASTAFDFTFESISASSGITDPCYSSGAPTTLQDLSSCYMVSMERDAKDLINVYTRANIQLQVDASAYVSYYGLLGGVTYAPNAYKRAQASFIDNVNSIFVIPAYVSISFQSVFMRFFVAEPSGGTASAILGFIVPGAFVLRFFPPTRQAGNMLIGFSMGIYLVVPLLVALNALMYHYTFTPDDCTTQYGAVIYDPINWLGDCSSSSNLLKVARLYPQAFLLPNIVIVLFISFVTAVNKALRVLG